jgi:heptosyltransferase-1
MKVLIVRTGAMGDVLHALPAVAALRQARPDWTIDWVVDPRWSPLLVDGEGRGPVVSRVHLADTRLWSRAPLSWAMMRSVTSLRRALRAEKYDAVVDMQGTLRSAVIGKMAGAKDLVGYGDPRERMARWWYSEAVERLEVPQGLKPLSNNAPDGGTKVPPLPSSNDHKVRVPPLPSENFDATEAWFIPNAHVVEQGAALLGAATGVEVKPAVVELPRELWAERWAETEAVVERPLCLLGAGGGWGAKQWPAERYGALAKALRGMGFDVAVNAPRREDAVAHAVVAASEGAARTIVCNVAGLVALMRRTDLVVAGDTGPLHLAAALAVPAVALFGPTDPARNGPWGPGKVRVLRDASSVTSYRRGAETEAGLAKISVAQVVEAVRGLVDP